MTQSKQTLLAAIHHFLTDFASREKVKAAIVCILPTHICFAKRKQLGKNFDFQVGMADIEVISGTQQFG